MNDAELELLSAFFDGRPVDAAQLALILGDPASLETLRDFARLRASVAATTPLPRDEWVAVLRARLAREAGARPRGLRLAAAAALVVVAASLHAWSRWQAPGPSSAVASKAQAGDELPPAPSRTLAFENGKDWITR